MTEGVTVSRPWQPIPVWSRAVHICVRAALRLPLPPPTYGLVPA